MVQGATSQADARSARRGEEAEVEDLMPERVSSARVAEILGVPLRTVQSLTACGDLPAAKIGKRWTYDEATVRHWVKEREQCQKNARRRPTPTGEATSYGRGSPLGDASIGRAYEQAIRRLRDAVSPR